mgnify:CR=1 FL=1|tara:strand:+ start:330 stop:839 length:510 start_codon:yes stop_codon:yes gene_type:complete
MPGLAEMTSVFQPGATSVGDGLAEGGGLENVTNDGSNLNIDENPILSNALAEAGPYDGLAQNGQGLENVTNEGSLLNNDGTPELTLEAQIENGQTGLGLEAMMADDSNLDIDIEPIATTGIANLGLIQGGWDLTYGNGSGIVSIGAPDSNFDYNGTPPDMSDGLATPGS